MRGAQEIDIHKEKEEGTVADVTSFGSCEMFEFRERLYAFIHAVAAFIIDCTIGGSVRFSHVITCLSEAFCGKDFSRLRTMAFLSRNEV